MIDINKRLFLHVPYFEELDYRQKILAQPDTMSYKQIFYNNHLVKIEDWSALMDTTGAVAFVSAVLLTVTIILNAITLIIYRNRTVN